MNKNRKAGGAMLSGPGKESGQILVEYVLLLVVIISIYVMMHNLVVARNPDNPGFMIKAWNDMIDLIGSDYADAP